MPKHYAVREVSSLAFLASQAHSVYRAQRIDFRFLQSIIRMPEDTPEYGGYNTRNEKLSHCPSRPKTKAIYTPLLDTTPCDPDTVLTSMYEVQRITQSTGQEYTFYTTDQQLYKIVVGVLWAYPSQFQSFIPRLGRMHMLINVFCWMCWHFDDRIGTYRNNASCISGC